MLSDRFHRELQLLDGLAKCGMGNWSAVAELIGTRTPEEVEQHYTECYLNSPDWPLPVCFLHIYNIIS